MGKKDTPAKRRDCLAVLLDLAVTDLGLRRLRDAGLLADLDLQRKRARLSPEGHLVAYRARGV